MFNGVNFVFVLGAMLVLGGYLLRRNARAVHRSSRRDVHSEAREQLQRAATAVDSHVERQEVRLHEFERQIDARTATRIAQLETLIVEARQAAARLETLLARANGEKQDVAPELQPLIEELQGAGYTAAEIATIVSRSRDEVQQELDRRGAA